MVVPHVVETMHIIYMLEQCMDGDDSAVFNEKLLQRIDGQGGVGDLGCTMESADRERGRVSNSVALHKTPARGQLSFFCSFLEPRRSSSPPTQLARHSFAITTTSTTINIYILSL